MTMCGEVFLVTVLVCFFAENARADLMPLSLELVGLHLVVALATVVDVVCRSDPYTCCALPIYRYFI